MGNATLRRDGKGLETTFTYYPDNTVETTTNPESETTRTEYDILGNVSRVNGDV